MFKHPKHPLVTALPTLVRLIYSAEKLTVENRKSRERKTDMLRSIGKQSGESVESVQEEKR